jgi:hypothetical protein
MPNKTTRPSQNYKNRPQKSKERQLADYALKRNPWMANVTDRDMQMLNDGKTTITALKQKYSKNKKAI